MKYLLLLTMMAASCSVSPVAPSSSAPAVTSAAVVAAVALVHPLPGPAPTVTILPPPVVPPPASVPTPPATVTPPSATDPIKPPPGQPLSCDAQIAEVTTLLLRVHALPTLFVLSDGYWVQVRPSTGYARGWFLVQYSVGGPTDPACNPKVPH